METIIEFINANGRIFEKGNIKLTYRVYIILLILMLCMLPFTGDLTGILGMIILSLYAVAACIYNRRISKNNFAFREIFISFLFMFCYILIAFNFALYSSPKLMKLNLELFVILIIAFEIVCFAFGCFYTYLSIKMKKIKVMNKANSLTVSIIFVLSGSWTIFLRRFVSKVSIEIQAFILISIIAIACCVFAFYLGRIFIPLLYFIEKYKIKEFDFSDE